MSKCYKLDNGAVALVRNDELFDLSVEKDGITIDINNELLRDLMANTMRNRLIARLEQMTTEEIFVYFGIGDT